jgi:hypothetical protein
MTWKGRISIVTVGVAMREGCDVVGGDVGLAADEVSVKSGEALVEMEEKVDPREGDRKINIPTMRMMEIPTTMATMATA